jgi:hypothetical protein
MGGKHSNYGKIRPKIHMSHFFVFDTIIYLIIKPQLYLDNRVYMSESAIWLALGHVFLQLTSVLKLRTFDEESVQEVYNYRGIKCLEYSLTQL